MKAIAHQHTHAIDHPDALHDITLPDPVATGRDLLVEVRAVSVNPVDTKIRRNRAPAAGEWQVLGWDAAGVVRAVGPEVAGFRPGNRVWYAGDLRRPGTNAELHLVDERIVGHMPRSLDFADAAALPLTAITAWEMLFDCWGLREGEGGGDSLLVIGGAGGVGSILIQLAKRLTGLTVIASASRPESVDWVRALGADHVIDHRQPLAAQVSALGPQPRYVAALTATDQHFDAIVELIRPRGHVAVIDDPATLDIAPGKRKALSFSWEFMFTRSMFETDDIAQQRALLERVAALVDAGQLRSTRTGHLGTIDAANLRRAHALQESGRVIGKNVLEGF